MAEKNVFVVEEIGGTTYIVVAESGSQAKNAVKKELTVRRASALEVVTATSKGATLLDAEAALAAKAAAMAARSGAAGGDEESEEGEGSAPVQEGSEG